jgi:hypothetical protein
LWHLTKRDRAAKRCRAVDGSQQRSTPRCRIEPLFLSEARSEPLDRGEFLRISANIWRVRAFNS